MTTNPNITALVQKYVLQLLWKQLPATLYFHNIGHTQNVVQAAIEIASKSGFDTTQTEIVTLAAWFHDCGYTRTYDQHEEASKTIAQAFLQNHQYPAHQIAEVLRCIDATKFPQNPKSPESQVLADADLYHLSLPDYPTYAQKLRTEWALLGKHFSDTEWTKTNLNLLKCHSYFTTYGKNVLQKHKEQNINLLEKTLQTL